ncbi:MAG: type I-U CRISPR-associated protein Cas5/Cas6 [Gammaproteobacteria bacterium]|nr:type I-U CRISPR-associated protein Cas5/Cas6 [Gammaproteobacteria bacterium]
MAAAPSPHPPFVIHLHYLTGTAVATHVSHRERAEWPPHPGRVYLALAAAHFETDGSEQDKQAEREALTWLERLPAPAIRCWPAGERTPVTTYVPVNDDTTKPVKSMLQSAPGLPRSRQARHFPAAIPCRASATSSCPADVSLIWHRADNCSAHQRALDRLCQHLICVGHSTSLVMAWTATGETAARGEHWSPAASLAQRSLRIAAAGEYERLEQAFGLEAIERFVSLKSRVESTRGKAKAAAKQAFENTLGVPYKNSLRPPEPRRPRLGTWQGYQKSAGTENSATCDSNAHFDANLLVLSRLDGPALNVERTLTLTRLLRGALLSHTGPAPTWLSGHAADGSAAAGPHLALLPLPFAGHPHADGHLLGLALALPRTVAAEEIGEWLGPALIDQTTGAPGTLHLRSHGLHWRLQLENRPSPPLALRSETWTAPSACWASVTPVVLDRYPKHRPPGSAGWRREVAAIVALACTRAGLPQPAVVDVDAVSWHQGMPRAWVARRGGRDTARAHGDGFPLLHQRHSNARRVQVHVWLRFTRPLSGPVLLGAGRFLGYGLCKPTDDPRDTLKDG